MGKLRLNKKALAGIMSGFMLLSFTGCSNGHFWANENKTQESNFYYLNSSVFDDVYVFEDDEVKRIVDKRGKSIYSYEKYNNKDDSYNEDIYKYLDSELINVSTYTKSDWINLEKYINGNDTYDLLPKGNKYEELLISDNIEYRTISCLSCWYDGSISEIEVMFIDGKVDRIVRRLKEEDNGNKTIDIISNRVIAPDYKIVNVSKLTTIDNKNLSNKEIKFIPITDIMNETSKNEFTGQEVVDIFYDIYGKSLDDVKLIINEMYSRNEKTLILK